MSQIKEIFEKIGSIKSTQKITSAMELVATSKLRKAQGYMLSSRPYSAKARSIVKHVATSSTEYRDPYLEPRKIQGKVGFIVVTTDRGLCGGLNINLLRLVFSKVKDFMKSNISSDFCLLGKKGNSFFKRIKGNVLVTLGNLGSKPSRKDIAEHTKIILEKYRSGEINAVYIASNEFINTMTQKPIIKRLFPIEVNEKKEKQSWDYIYEPDSSKELLDLLIKTYIESQIYQSVVENAACEQAARMIAMKNATDNAKNLIKDLELIYNRARQASITQEISEIVGGAAAIL